MAAEAQEACAKGIGNRAWILVAHSDRALQIVLQQRGTNRAEDLSCVDFHTVKDDASFDNYDQACDRTEQHGVHRHPALHVIVY